MISKYCFDLLKVREYNSSYVVYEYMEILAIEDVEMISSTDTIGKKINYFPCQPHKDNITIIISLAKAYVG